MKVYVLILERELIDVSSPHVISRTLFSTKQKAVEYLDTVILNNHGIHGCDVKVTDWSVTIKWWLNTTQVKDMYYLDSMELDPHEYPMHNETDYYLTFWD